MLKKYNVLFASTAFALLNGCMTAPTNMSPKSVRIHDATFNITPDGTLVELRDPKTNTLLESCETPCTLTFDAEDAPDYVMSYPGMVEKRGNLNSKPELDFPLLGGRSYRYGDTTLTGEMLTPEQDAIRIEERDKKIAERRAKRERQNAVREAAAAGDMDEVNRLLKATPSDCAEGQMNPEDEKALPLVRIPPRVPMLNKSGHCKVRFNVNREGQAVDIDPYSCTDPGFAGPSVGSVALWKYNPKIKDGEAISRCGVETKLTFQVMDENGKILPE